MGESIDRPADRTDKRLPYEPPKAALVPLRIEERLLACDKYPSGGQDCKEIDETKKFS